MSRRIYTATNGNCIVGGQPPPGEEAAVRQDFEAGVSLVVDTTGGDATVRGAIPAHRDAPEALVGVVTVPRGDDPLRGYHDAVREVFDDRSGWRVRTDVLNGQLFEALGPASGPTPDDDLLSSVRERRRDGERVEIGVPDPTNAVGVLRSLLDDGSDGVFVISTQEPPEHVETDVFVHLADRYARPELIDLESDLSPSERIGRRVDELVDERPPSEVATQLEAETRQRDVSLGFEADSGGGGLVRSVLAGVGVGLAAAVLLAGVRPAASGSPVTLDLGWLPVVGTTLSVPPWAPLAAGLVAVVAAVSVPRVRRLLGAGVGLDAVLGGREELEPAQRERLETAATILEQHALERDADPYRTAKSALETQPIQATRRSAVRRLVGVLGSLVPAVLLVAAAWLLLGALPTGIVTTALFAIAAITLVVRAGIAVRAIGAGFGKLLSGGSSDREPDDREPEEADDADAGDDDLGVRPAEKGDGNDDSIGVAAADDPNPVSDPAEQDRDDEGGSEPPADEGSFPVEDPEHDDGGAGETAGRADPTGDEVGITDTSDGGGVADTGGRSDGDEEPSPEPEAGEGTPTDDAFGAERGVETADDEPEADETGHLFDSASTESDEQERHDTTDPEPTVADEGGSPPIGESSPDEPGASTEGDREDRGVARRGGPKPTGTGVDETTTRGPFEQFFDEFPVTAAPVVTDEQVFVAGDAGLHDRSVPIDRSWLPEHHAETVRHGQTQAHLTRLTHDGERDNTVPFTSPFAEPIVRGDDTVYVVDSSGTVAALGDDSPTVESFRYQPTHFSANRWLYVSGPEKSRVLTSDLQVRQELSGQFSVSPMVAGESVTLCFEDRESRRINLSNGRINDFPAPEGPLVGSVVVGGTPYVASESGRVWSGWERGWEERMNTARSGFRWLSANDSTIVLAGRSIIHTREAGTLGVNSLEATVSTPPVVTEDSVYFVSEGDLVRADLELNGSSRIDLPWPSVDGLAAGADRLYVVADGAVWTVPSSTVREGTINGR